jgi:23S rRNA (cytosine1962-C5)-methyltransferase
VLDALAAALQRRAAFFAARHAEGTDCYRILHGVAEGAPGVAVDRYGPILLLQTWREPLALDLVGAVAEEVQQALGVELWPVWNHRGDPGPFARCHDPELPESPIGRELGLAYDVRPRHRGRDPLLFLDLRALRRRLLHTPVKSVLNLFAYTGGVGLCGAAAGAAEVWNVDFAASALQIADQNARRNGLESRVRSVRTDALAAVRQLAGQKAGRVRPTEVLSPRPFELVVLDPPRLSKGRYGAVDVVRDYPTLLKPAVLATAPGGLLAATNHVPEVDREGWVEGCLRCARKAGRPLADVELLAPEEDFPSPDGRPPLKILWARVP